MDKSRKLHEVELLSDYFARAQAAFVADYRGLTVEEITVLRKHLRDAGAVGRVVKNRLTTLSVQKVYGENGNSEALQKFTEQFLGPSFLVVAFDEVVAPAKVLTKFATDNEKFALKGGWFEGSFLAEAGIEELSKLPSREETLAKLLNLLTAPATQLLRVTNAPGTNVVQLLAACRDKLEKEQG